MQHNFGSYTGRTNEEIAEDNKKKYMDEIKPSWTKQKWYYKYSRKKVMKIIFVSAYFFGLITGVLICVL